MGGRMQGNIPIDANLEYDIDKNEWAERAPMLAPRLGHSVSPLNDEMIYIIGGISAGAAPLSRIDIYITLAPTSVEQSNNSKMPYSWTLNQNYPNPFNPTTTISYQLPITSHVELTIHSINGQKITTLVSEQQQAGNYRFEWDGGDLASGVYVYQLQTNDFTASKKLILLK